MNALHPIRCIWLMAGMALLHAGIAEATQSRAPATPKSRWSGAGTSSGGALWGSSPALVESGTTEYRHGSYAALPEEREIAGLSLNVVGPLHGASKSFVAPRYRLTGKPTDWLETTAPDLNPSW